MNAIERPALAILLAACLLAGCCPPNQAAIEARKERDEARRQLTELQQQYDAVRRQLESYQNRVGTLQTLPQERLDKLATVHAVEIGRLSGAADLDPNKEGHEGLKIYLRPVDESGIGLKATGTVIVEAFNLDEQPVRIGRWEFTPEQLKPLWRELGPLEGFVLTLPWQTSPSDSTVSFKVMFTDELTGRRFEDVRQTVVRLPGRAAAPHPIARP